MDRKALTEKRRETVIGLLKSMSIKKDTEGGFDKDDVYNCMQQLCDLYEQNIEELQNSYEGELLTLKERYQKYDENNELYVSLIMEAKKSSNDIINQAKTEVESILAEGKEQIAKQEEELKLLYAGVETEKNAINEELNASRKAVEAEKLAMQADVDAEREKCNALKNKYTQQMNAMEEEFMDIKTNILRTAGKIDSIKSKLNDEDAYSWEISEEQDDIAFPENADGVEDILPVEETEAAEAAEEPAVEPVGFEDVPTVDEIIAAEAENVVAEEAPAEEVEEPVEEAVEEIPEVEEEELVTADSEIIIEDTEEAEEAIPTEINVEDLLKDLGEEPEAAAVEEIADVIETPEVPAEEIAAEATEVGLGEINFDDIDFSSLDDELSAEGAEEISFEGLENLFKED